MIQSCSECKGKGYRVKSYKICSACHGTGFRSTEDIKDHFKGVSNSARQRFDLEDSHEVPCDVCRGKGEVEVRETCPTCKGKGEVNICPSCGRMIKVGMSTARTVRRRRRSTSSTLHAQWTTSRLEAYTVEG